MRPDNILIEFTHETEDGRTLVVSGRYYFDLDGDDYDEFYISNVYGLDSNMNYTVSVKEGDLCDYELENIHMRAETIAYRSMD